MFDIGCVTSWYKISEGSKMASGDLQYIIIAVQCIVLVQCEVNLNLIAN